jgi:hypothetical protein
VVLGLAIPQCHANLLQLEDFLLLPWLSTCRNLSSCNKIKIAFTDRCINALSSFKDIKAWTRGAIHQAMLLLTRIAVNDLWALYLQTKIKAAAKQGRRVPGQDRCNRPLLDCSLYLQTKMGAGAVKRDANFQVIFN